MVVMGQVLSEPITTKQTANFDHSNFKVASSCMQGWRTTMEDAHSCIMSLKEDPNSQFFGVFDGHGGSKIAHYACKHLPHRLCTRLEYKNGQIESACKRSFLDLDKEMSTNAELAHEFSGSTACCVLIRQTKLYCINVGDSRAVASIKGHPLPLSYDHKPNNIGEQSRIIKAGGFVELNRVNGNLALSRALGDFTFKRNFKKQPEEQIVTALPDVTVHDIGADLEFAVVACDGIWDVLSNHEAIQFCRQRIANHMDPAKICEELLTRCLATECNQGGLGCDNMTVILICFLHGESYQHLAKKCSRPSNLSSRATAGGGGGGLHAHGQDGSSRQPNGASLHTPTGILPTLVPRQQTLHHPFGSNHSSSSGAGRYSLNPISSNYSSRSSWRY